MKCIVKAEALKLALSHTYVTPLIFKLQKSASTLNNQKTYAIHLVLFEWLFGFRRQSQNQMSIIYMHSKLGYWLILLIEQSSVRLCKNEVELNQSFWSCI